MNLAEKLNPRKLGYSPKMAAIVGAIIGHDYGSRDPRGGKIGHISITSDGFIIAQTTSHETGAFLGEASDLERNLIMLVDDAKLTKEERAEYDRLYHSNVTDWRA